MNEPVLVDRRVASPAVVDGCHQLVMMIVAGQLCGLPVQGVVDVLGPAPLALIPLAPPEIVGSLNLRGRIVVVLDLRRRLGLPLADGKATRMSVVTELRGEPYALLADQVFDVAMLPAAEMARVPATLPAMLARHCAGVHRHAGRSLLVLDPASLLNFSELDPDR